MCTWAFAKTDCTQRTIRCGGMECIACASATRSGYNAAWLPGAATADRVRPVTVTGHTQPTPRIDTRVVRSSTEGLRARRRLAAGGGRRALCAESGDAISTNATHSRTNAPARLENTTRPFNMGRTSRLLKNAA